MITTENNPTIYSEFMNCAYRLDNQITRPSKAEFQNLLRLED